MLSNAFQTLTYLSSIKDVYLNRHHRTVSFYAVQMAKALKLSIGDIKIIRQAALLHDTGKIGIPNSILFKPGSLTSVEWEIMKLHPVTGAELLSSDNSINIEIIRAIRHHHEKWDGSGYPDGLKGDSIPLAARIIAVADAFDAITSDRHYKKALSKDNAIREIIRCTGKHFDPIVIDAFLTILKAQKQLEVIIAKKDSAC